MHPMLYKDVCSIILRADHRLQCRYSITGKVFAPKKHEVSAV